MKQVRYHRRAQRALLKHSAEARRIVEKVGAYSANPKDQANNVKRLKGATATFRLRVGDYRVIFVEDDETIIVTDVGPRGSVYD